MPPHVWREDTAAKLLAPYCWIQSIEPIMAAGDDLSSFRLIAWTNKPSSLPQILWLNVAEHEVRSAETRGVRFRGTQPFLWKDTLRYRIIVHLRCVHDYSPQPDYRGDGSSSDDPAEDGRNSRHHHSHRDSGTEIYPFPCHRGEPDGNAPGTSGGGGQDRNRDRQGPRRRVPAHQRLGPHGKAHVPAPQRIGSYEQPRPGQKSRKQFQAPRQVWRPKQAKRQEAAPTQPEIAKADNRSAATSMGGTGTATPQPAHLVEDQDAQGGQLATDEQLQDKRPPITQFAPEIPEVCGRRRHNRSGRRGPDSSGR